MIFGRDLKEERRRELDNALATMSNALYAIQHKPDSWDTRIKAMQEIGRVAPLVIRYMIYFKNVEGG